MSQIRVVSKTPFESKWLKVERQYMCTLHNLVYGQTYAILNGYASFTGGYLDVCGSGCEGNKLCVSTATTKNRDNGSGTWKFLEQELSS